MKTVYNYADNGVFLGVGEAQESPLEPGVFLMPRNSTDVAPELAPEGFILVWDSEATKWVHVPEYRVTEEEVLSDEGGERIWRDRELSRADVEINKVQDGEGTGTVKAWREYRVALRAYPSKEGFPNIKLRPVAPDAGE